MANVDYFKSPEDVQSAINRDRGQSASAFGLNFANGLRTSNRNKIFAQIGAAFGSGLGQSAFGGQSAEVQQAKVRQSILSNINPSDEKSLYAGAQSAIENSDPELAFMLNDKATELKKIRIAQENEYADRAQKDRTAQRLQDAEDRRLAWDQYVKTRDEENQKFKERQFNFQQSVASFSQALQSEKWDSQKQINDATLALMDLRGENISMRSAQIAAELAKPTGDGKPPPKSTTDDVKNVMLAMKNRKDPKWDAMNQKTQQEVAKYIADIARSRTTDGSVFSSQIGPAYDALDQGGAFEENPLLRIFGLQLGNRVTFNPPAPNPQQVSPPGADNPFLNKMDPAKYGYTEEDINTTMQKYNMTREQVFQELEKRNSGR